MSVAIYGDEELDDLFGQVFDRQDIIDKVFTTDPFVPAIRDQAQRFCKAMGKTFDEAQFRLDTINGLACRLGFCNKLAYAVSYKEPMDFFADSTNKAIVRVPCSDPDELLSHLNNLNYNMVAQDGTTYVPYGWYGIFRHIIACLERIVKGQPA